MGSLILTMHTSADGFVATDDGSMWPGFGWPAEAQEVLSDLYRETSAVVYGRRIFETVVPFWSDVAREGIPPGSPLSETDLEFARLLEPLPKHVVSRAFTPEQPGVSVIRDEVAARVRELKESAGGHVLVLAGGALAGELAAAGLLDEIFLLVGTVVLGSGRPLLALDAPLATRLRDARPLPPHSAILRYEVTDAPLSAPPGS